jgi:hypothetical protein
VGQPLSPLGFRDFSPAPGASVTRARTAGRSAQQQRSRAAGTVPFGFGPSRLQTQFAAVLGGAAQHSNGVQRSDDIESSSPGEQHQTRGPSNPIQQSSLGPQIEQPDIGLDSEGQIEQRTPIQRDHRVRVLHRATPPAQLGALAATTPAIGEGITAESAQQQQQQAGTSNGQVR